MLDKLLIDKAKKIVQFNADGSARWTAEDISNLSINVTTESNEKRDAQNSVISRLYNGKDAEITFETAFFSLGIQAAQAGTTVNEFSEENPAIVPWIDELTVGGTDSANTTITLTHVPVGTTGSEVTHIYVRNPDASLGKKFAVGSEADAEHFTVTASSKTITLPVGADIKPTDVIVVFYDYKATSGVSVTDTSDVTVDPGRLCIFTQFKDVCNEEIKYSGVTEFPSAQISPDKEIGFNFDDTYSVTLTANKKYCGGNGDLFTTYIPQE